MTVTVFTEALHPCAFIVSEAPAYQSRDSVTIAVSQTILAGQVLGKTGTPASETDAVGAAAGNAGNGTIGTVTIGGTAVDGAYVLVMLTAGATAEFELHDPNGIVVGTGKVGTAFVGPLSFTITAGGNAFAVGDEFTITVARPLALDAYEALNLSASDGSNVAVAIAAYPITTGGSATGKIMAITRRAEVRLADLTWPSGATTAQINEGVVQLNKVGITCR